MRRLLNLLGRAWRLVATGLSFSLFGIGSLILGLIVMPLLRLTVRNRDRRMRWSRFIVGLAMRGFWFFMHTLGLLRYELTGTEHVHPGRNYLVVANHPSLIDVVYLLSLFPHADCVIKEALRRNFFMRHLMISVDYVSNHDPVEWLTHCVERLQAGRTLILFPEGTRTVPDHALEFRAGASTIAVRSGVEVLPIVIDCNPPTLRKGEPWFHVAPRQVLYRFAIGAPFTAESTVGEVTDLREAGREFGRHLLHYFSERVNDPARGRE